MALTGNLLATGLEKLDPCRGIVQLPLASKNHP
jgi:hypothetical protein